MPPKKDATLNLRIDPAVKEALRQAAALDRRSISNLLEVLIREYCDRKGIVIPDQGALFDDD